MKVDVKKLIILNIPYVIVFYMVDKVAWLYRHVNGDLAGMRLVNTFTNFKLAFQNPLPSFYPTDILIGIAGALIMKAVVYYRGKNAKKFRQGVEYGSARWGTPADIKPYVDEKDDNNIILTETERLTMSSRPKNPKYARNKNILVVGGSGSGKTRFFVKPNIMQLHSSYCITDPKGTLLVECGNLLAKAKYQIKVLNLINFKKSMHYNPFMYIHSEKNILKLVNTIIANTKGEGDKSVFRAKGNSGKHVASTCPYGYLKDENDGNHWIVDEEAAEVVRRIFRLTIEGYGPYQITQILKNDKVEIPAVHMARFGQGLNKSKTFKDPYNWSSSTVVSILRKPEYMGHTVNFKTAKHFKDKKSHYVSQYNWVIFENTQEPIIDQLTFDLVQKIRSNVRRYPDGWGEVHLLTGLMYCADCGAKMYVHRVNNGTGEADGNVIIMEMLLW